MDSFNSGKFKQVLYYTLISGVVGLGAVLFLMVFWGGYELKTVTSGSMSPSIATGSVVAVDTAVSTSNIQTGDVITYEQPVGSGEYVTHRVVEQTASGYTTQGDANSVPDRDKVGEQQVLGTVNFSVPYLGYVASSIYTPIGLSLLIIVPTLLVVYTELRNIWRELKLMKLPRFVMPPPPKSGDKIMSVTVLAVSALAFSTASTSAIFTDTADNQDNSFATAEVFLAGDVVINEVYYNVADDKRGPAPHIGKYQWVELYNPTEETVSLKGWQLCGSSWCSDINPQIDIDPGEYTLLAHDSSIWPQFWGGVQQNTANINLGGSPDREMDVEADMLKLRDGDGDIVDVLNWGEANTEWDNYTDDLWSEGVDTALEGYSLQRIEDGSNTESPQDWRASAEPSPGR